MIDWIRAIVHGIHHLIPKRKHAVVYGWPDYEDSIIALEEALQDTDLVEVIVLSSAENSARPWLNGDKTRSVKKNSPLGLWLFLRSRYVFLTHPCFVRRFPKGVISVNIWHGMPIKRIGRMLGDGAVIQSSHLSATSPFWGGIMRRSMRADQIIEDCGLPRNDRLFCDRAEALSKLGLPKDNHFACWLPTYRRSLMGEQRHDGHDHGNPCQLPDINLEIFNDFLSENDLTIFIKPHPMTIQVDSNEWSHLKIIHDSWLTGHELTLYETIGASDILITDISSVMIDYLLADKPIIHAFPDIEEYRDSRGFSVEPIEDFFAGEVVNNQEELLKALDMELSGTDPHAKKRRAIRDLSHVHQDDQATQRLLKAIDLM